MIPILYEKTETTFTSNGLGRLASCTRCIVTEERNGVYECEFDFPISDPKYELIQEGRIIAVTHDDNGDIQPFDIYHRTAPIGGVVTFYAKHVSYRQNGITVKPFTASGVANAIAGLKTNSVGTNPFKYTTDKTTTGTYTVTVPSSLKALLGGEQNSLLDVFGAGEYEFDKFTTKLWTRRGSDTDVEIRYGKNLFDIEHDIDFSDSYNGVVPYWFGTVTPEPEEDEEEQPEPYDVLVTLSEWAIYANGTTYDGRNTVYPLDLSSEFQEPPTEAELRTLATTKLNADNTLLAKENRKVSFVQLWQTEEYKNIAPLQQVKLCDTVNVIFPELGVNKVEVKVIKVVYNVLLDRYDEMELGDSLASYAAIVTANNSSAIAQLEDGLLMVSDAANKAQIDADTAHTAAISAQADAADAHQAALDAQESAEVAHEAADRALESADQAGVAAYNAQHDANTANYAANGALTQLSVVEDVLGVLNWASEHATYVLTNDRSAIPGKLYFTRSGSGTAADPYVYTVASEYTNAYLLNADGDNLVNKSGNKIVSRIETNDFDPYELGLYEISDIDEAVSNYVQSHLALTNEGLWVLNDNNSYKILLAADGMKVYDDLGALVATFGESITYSSIRPQYIGNAQTYIKYYDTNNDGVADSIEIAGDNVNIASSVTIGGMPTKVSDLDNDSGYQTANNVNDAISSATSGLLTSASAKDQYYLSTSTLSATGGSWQDTVPTWESGKYIWTRVATTKTTSSGSTTTYSTAVYDSALTKALSDANGAAYTVTTTKQYYLSTSASSKAGGAWSDSVPSWSTGKYIWIRFKIEKTTVGSTTTTTYTPSETGVYDSTITTALQTANDAAPKSDAVGSTVAVYYRSTTEIATPNSIKPTSSTAIGTSATTDNAWEYVMPQPKYGRYFYTSIKHVKVNGDVSFSDVRPIDNATYTSKWCSQADNAYIDGGRIYAHSVTADQMAAGSITIGNMDDDTKSSLMSDGLEIITSYSGSNIVFSALLRSGGYDVTNNYPTGDFEWFIKTQEGTEFLGNGRSYTMAKSSIDYGQTIYCTWSRNQNVYLLNNGGNNLVDNSGNKLVGRTEV